ncbi:hypothetical protein OCK74_08920 [Chitinophagaceae bacterium LB-8]|uniref:Uncharacterized protein n=1 Tax=Paraflavisolibacter caeni TaxID=2982496 RepID=A0A9X2XUE6_9BACT|nr:hypothetical protein [Paraflavisolibacter caeni]MCU7549236.1 hypothetical protein [Paraflavisolibacter caeni]
MIPADSAQLDYAKKLNLDSFIVVKFDYNLKKYLDNWLKAGRMTPTNYAIDIKAYKGDTSLISASDTFNTELLFLFGKRADGRYVIVADQNNNKSFTDDSLFVMAGLIPNYVSSRSMLDTLPHVKINNIKAHYNGAIQTLSLNLILKPGIINPDEPSIDVSEVNGMRLILYSFEHVTGLFKYKGKKYKVSVGNQMQPYRDYNQRYIVVKFNPMRKGAVLKDQNPRLLYDKGDTLFSLGKQQFIIKNISPTLDEITIQQLKKKKS